MIKVGLPTDSLEFEGERLANITAPPMLALCALSVPLVGVAKSLATLNSSPGYHLRVTAPISLGMRDAPRNFPICLGLREYSQKEPPIPPDYPKANGIAISLAFASRQSLSYTNNWGA